MDIAHIPPRVAAVIREVALERQISVEELLGPSRRAKHASARHEAMRRVRRVPWAPGWMPCPSLEQIGRWFDRHHTTVVHACRPSTARIVAVDETRFALASPPKRESMAA